MGNIICKYEEKILSLMKKGINYNQILAKELKIKPNTLIELLKKLEKQRFIVSFRLKENNKKIYILTSRATLLLNYYKDLRKFKIKYKEFLK